MPFLSVAHKKLTSSVVYGALLSNGYILDITLKRAKNMKNCVFPASMGF